MRYQGRITNWNDDKGYGFVTPNGGGEKAFVHITAFSNSHRRPTESDLITYELATDQQHRLQAGSIRFVGDPNPSSAQSGKKSVGAIFATLFCCFVVTVSVIGKLSFAVPFFMHLQAPLPSWSTHSTKLLPSTIAGERKRGRCICLAWLAAGLVHSSHKECFATNQRKTLFNPLSG